MNSSRITPIKGIQLHGHAFAFSGYTASTAPASIAAPATMWKLFRIFYNSLFTVLGFLLLVLTLFVPGDIIYQSYRNNRLANIFAVTGVYVVTALLAVLIYASRIFTNRSVLAGIPKLWIPVEKPDVPKNVRRLVVENLHRSAVIVQQARPRDRTGEDNSGLDPELTFPAEAEPPWGDTSHPGWTAPECPDLPNQDFETVIRELPNLLEAKVVSLAPPDPRFMRFDDRLRPHNDFADDIPDERIVEVLQRPKSMCLRGYLNHLARLGMVHDLDAATSFVRLFETARYSNRPLTEPEFRSMMGLFAELLRGMKRLDPVVVAEILAELPPGGTDTMSTYSGPSSSDDKASLTSDAASFSSSQRNGSSRYHPLGASAFDDGRSFRLRNVGDQQSTRSMSSGRGGRTPSFVSLRPVRSNLSASSSQSVIRRSFTQDSSDRAVADGEH